MENKIFVETSNEYRLLYIERREYLNGKMVDGGAWEGWIMLLSTVRE